MQHVFRKHLTTFLVVPGVVLGVMFGAILATPASSVASGKVHLVRASLVSANPADAGTVTAQSASFATPESTTLTEAPGTLYAGDSDSDPNPSNQCCTASLYTQASDGTVTLDSPEDGGFTYVPNAGFSGTDTFQFVLSDTDGNVSAPATVTITVNALTAATSTYSVNEDQTWSVPDGVLLSGATDADSSATCCSASLVGQPADGSATVDSNGQFSYTPDNGFVGTDSFSYTLTDSDGNVSAPAAVTLNVDNSGTTPSVTSIVETDPPAASTTSSVTIIADVAPKTGSGPTPTGNVTFTYYTVGEANGGPASGTLGTVNVNSAGQAKIVTTPGELPAGGPLNGSIILNVTYNGNGTYAASNGLLVYYVVPNCDEGQFNKKSNGYPSIVADGQTGYYIGQSNGWFTLYTTQDTGHTMDFSGNAQTNGLVLYVSNTKNSGGYIKLAGREGNERVGWKIVDKGALDGFTFFAGCGSQVKFTLNSGSPAAPVPASEVFIGSGSAHGKTAGSITVKRKD